MLEAHATKSERMPGGTRDEVDVQSRTPRNYDMNVGIYWNDIDKASLRRRMKRTTVQHICSDAYWNVDNV